MNRKWGYSFICVFLASAFLLGCASTTPLPETIKPDSLEKGDLRQPELILGTGDVIEFAVYRQDDLKKSVKIDPSGKIMFPLIGDIQVSGKSVFALRDELKERYSVYFVNPQITVTVAMLSSQKIMVLGEVNSPGIFTLDSDFTIVEAIAKAGGMTSSAKPDQVTVVRRGREKAELLFFNFNDVLEKGNIAHDISLRSGDIVYASTKAIVDAGRFMQYIGQIISPITMLEGGIAIWPQVKDALKGGGSGTSVSVPIR